MDQQLTSRQPDDAELAHRALSAKTAQERAAAFEAIADRYRLEVLRQCSRWFADPDAAQDVGQITFEVAFTLLAKKRGPARPDKLGGWLIEIAKRRASEYRRHARPAGVTWAFLPEDRSLDELADNEESRSGSAVRQAHVTRLVEAVVATLTEHQQQMYRLRFVQELTGRQAAAQLGITDKAASNEATIVQALIADGFGALILFQEGRAYCAVLAWIIDDTVKATAGSRGFSAVLRERIVHHFGNCKTCDKCRTCNDKRRELVGPYVPGLIPILFAAEFRDRIDETIRRLTQETSQSQPRRQDPGAPTGVAALLAGTSAEFRERVHFNARPGLPPAGLPPRAKPDRPRRQGTPHHRRARRRVLLAAAGAAVVIAAAAIVSAAVLISGSLQPRTRSPVTVAAAPPTAVGAVVRVRPCGRTRPGTPATLRLPAGVSLPAGAAVFDTGVASLRDSPDGRYIIGPASQRCAFLPGGGGTTVLAVGAQDSPPRVFSMLMPGLTAPSCTASSGNLFAAMLAKASRAQTCRSASSPALPGAVTSVLLHDTPGLSAVVAWAPHTQSSAFFAPASGSLPTYAVFAARASGGQTAAYAPEGISCTLPQAQVSICSEALRYFLIQAAGTTVSPAALRAAAMAVQQFVAQPH